MDMNDAGNFLIETCDETVSRDLKQQLLLLNGRWRELFVKVKHVNILCYIIINMYIVSDWCGVCTNADSAPTHRSSVLRSPIVSFG